MMRVLMLVASMLAPGAQDPPAPVSTLSPDLAAIRMRIMSGEIVVALGQLSTLGDSPQVKYLTGLAHYHRDDHLRAIELLAPAVESLPVGSPERREAVQVLGLSYYAARRLREALPLLEDTRRWAADNRELGNVLGLTYLQTGQPDKARQVIAETFGVAPASVAAHLYTAQMMIRLELHEPAAAELNRALAIDSRAPQAHAMLGQLAVFRARLEEAIALFRKAIEINPLDAMAHYRLGEAYSRQQNWDAAIVALQQSIWINPYFSGPYIVLGRAYMARDQPAMAESLLRRAVEYDPNNKSAHYLLGQALQRQGRDADAAKEFEIAAALNETSQPR